MARVIVTMLIVWICMCRVHAQPLSGGSGRRCFSLSKKNDGDEQKALEGSNHSDTTLSFKDGVVCFCFA